MSVLDEYLRAAVSTKGKIVSPWMALGEQKVSAARVYLSPAPILNRRVQDSYDHRGLAQILLTASTYFWRNQIYEAIKQCPMPENVIADDIMPYDAMYNTFETGWDLDSLAECIPFKEPQFDYFLFVKDQDRQRIMVWIFVSTMVEVDSRGIAPQAFLLYFIPFGKKYPADFDNASKPIVKVVLSMLAFLKTPAKHIQKTKLPRSIRRKTANNEERNTEVAVVTLRLPQSHSASTHLQELGFKHQWWVTGHFRAQWYQSKLAHEVIWIAPHLKGPENAPVLEKVYNVAR